MPYYDYELQQGRRGTDPLPEISRKAILESPATRHRLIEWIESTNDRDPVDCLADARLLVKLLESEA